MTGKTKHILLVSITVVVLVVLMVFLLVEYKTNYRKTEVLSSSSGEYRLSIYMIGEPQFPYGYTKWGFSLYKGKSKITDESLSLFNDGQVVTEDNFSVTWTEKTVTIIASGSEQEDIRFVVSL